MATSPGGLGGSLVFLGTAAATTVAAGGGNKAGVLTVASTTGFVPGAKVSISGTSSSAQGIEATILAVPDATHLVVQNFDAQCFGPGAPGRAPPYAPSDVSAFTTGDTVRQEVQYAQVIGNYIPIASSYPSRAT